MRFFVPFRPLLKGWLISLLVWGGFFFAFAWQLVHAFSVPWADVSRMLGSDALLWIAITPLVFRLAARLPIERRRWKIALPAHLAAYFVTAVCFGGIMHAFGPGRMGGPPPPGFHAGAGGHPTPPRAWSVGWLFSGPQLPIYLALVSVAHAFHFSRRSQERERRSLELAASLADARLRALRMQIQPHFLFNSLNALAALIHKDPEAADEMLSELSDFLRLTLEDSGGQEVSLRRELEYAERYLAIEKVRFGDRLDFAIDAEEAALSALVPALLLQPLLENAVRHGIEPRRSQGRVAIRARLEGDRLQLSVSDDGVGLSAAPKEGVGLANTRTRLHELYGAAARLELRSKNGLCVEISFPRRMA